MNVPVTIDLNRKGALARLIAAQPGKKLDSGVMQKNELADACARAQLILEPSCVLNHRDTRSHVKPNSAQRRAARMAAVTNGALCGA